jgi:hypothetical protein
MDVVAVTLEKLLLPEYVAVMAWVPAVTDVGLQEVVGSVAVHQVVLPVVNATVPVATDGRLATERVGTLG